MKRYGQEGYVLFGIVIGVVILGIALTAAVPLWQKIVQREREQELIFRGYQYMQAIQLYQRKFAGAYPPKIEDLVEQKFLRKAYTDPFSEGGDGEFRIIRQFSPELQQPSQQQQRAAGAAAGMTDLNRSRARMRTPGGQTPGAPAQGFQSTLGRGASDAGVSGIVGVASASDEETFYKVPGKEKYKDWLFVYGGQQGGQVGQVGLGVPGGQVAGGQLPSAQIGSGGQAAGGQFGGRGPRARRGQFGQPGRVVPGQSGQGALSPFPGLPPPPGFTRFRFGSTGAGITGQVAPGGPPPGLGRPSNLPGQQPGFGRPGSQQQRTQPQQRRQ